ncbi:MAG TPA: DNA mismatch endonuclease Vsr [Bryobacteraceae bacterium]|nr:DNA mismatch endonuclease Vsr [Bryobacteraceae bacterium]
MDTFSPDRRSEIMRRVRSKDTKPEMIVRRLTHRLGFRFRLHSKHLPGNPDLVFARRRKVIFVNGCFWHRHNCSGGDLPASNQLYWKAKQARNSRRDKRNEAALKTLGWRVLIVWECEIKDREKLGRRLTRFLGAKNG